MVSWKADQGGAPGESPLPPAGPPPAGRTPLMDALDGPSYDLRLVRELARGALNERDAAGNTALHIAIRRGHAGAVMLLLEEGADPALADAEGRAALEIARHCGARKDLIRILSAPPRATGRVTRREWAALLEAQRLFVAHGGGGGAWRRQGGIWRYDGPAGQPVSLAERDLKGLDLRGVELPWADLRSCQARGQNLEQADLTGALLAGAELRQASLRGARLHGAVLEGARLAGAHLLEVAAEGARFAGADLAAASLRGARLRGADFAGATLTGCDLRDALIAGASFRDADLVGARIDWGPGGFPERERFRVRKVTLVEESEGPDYYSNGEFQVVDQAKGEIVARFSWCLDEPYLTNKSYSGPDAVHIATDGREAIAVDGLGHELERVQLPGRSADEL